MSTIREVNKRIALVPQKKGDQKLRGVSVEQLLRTIYRPWNFYCVHIDGKSSAQFHRRIKTITKCFPNLLLSSQSVTVHWASIYVLEAERICQRDLLRHSDKWKYLLNLSGQEFPLKTNLEIVEVLQELNGTNDVMSLGNPDGSGYNTWRQHVRYIVDPYNGIQRTNNKKTEPIPGNVAIYKGELHTALTRQFVEYLHKDPIAIAYYNWLNDTYCPDEHYYQSLNVLHNAPGTTGIINNQLLCRAKVWVTEPNSYVCKSRRVKRGICIFGRLDLPWLLEQPQLFANKFHFNEDPLVLNCLEEALNYRVFNPIHLNIDLYHNFSKSRKWGIRNTLQSFKLLPSQV
ncbi:N-acetyllactosaminide beta-1,6-N-acetylglucosaminyl-transferase-like [Saccoglossus kowalevskii]